MAFKLNPRSLLSSEARIQVPWVKVTLKGKNSEYTFGIYSRKTRESMKDKAGFYLSDVYNVQYPNYIQSLNIVKINGQVNQYTLNIIYPITQYDDPNFFEKIFSNISSERKIIFSYGDASMPDYFYKDEEAIITTITQTFDLTNSRISYTINATSSAALKTLGNGSWNKTKAKPSDIIKRLFKTDLSANNSKYTTNSNGLASTFTGMNANNIDSLICGDDAEVEIEAKSNMSVLDYITYLVSCMVPSNTKSTENPKNIYVLTIHDSSTYDSLFNNYDNAIHGPYFKVEKVSYNTERSDAYEIDVGYNTRTIVTEFSLENNENYSLYYDYQNTLNQNNYVRRINDKGQWEDVYSPMMLSKNSEHEARAEDRSWWTKITQFPVNATITVQGLLRPAHLLTYVRLNVIFPGEHKHIASGLYIITKQEDKIDSNGYKTTLSMTKVGGDLSENYYNINSLPTNQY